MAFLKQRNLTDRILYILAWLNSLGVVFVLALYGHEGSFSRYLSDDYCESVWLYSSANVLEATLTSYNEWTGRFSKVPFAWIVELGGIHGFQAMSGVILALWLAGLVWLLTEIARAVGMPLKIAMSIWLAGLAIFLSLYQAPTLYQILYWRSGAQYSVPLPIFVILAAFILWYVRQPMHVSRTIGTGLLCFVWAFLSSGFGETTAGLLAGITAGVLFVTVCFHSQHKRWDVEAVLATPLLGSIVALIVIATAPGTSIRLGVMMEQSPIYNPFLLGAQAIIYAAQFLWDTVKVTPLPGIISLAAPFGMMFVQMRSSDPIRFTQKQIVLAIAAVLLIMFIAIGFSFVPSAFVRTYPVARARFASHFMVTFSLILVGGMLGVLVSQIKRFAQVNIIILGILLLLGGLSLYPFYVAPKVSASLAENRVFAAAWDQRNMFIQKEIASGKTDLVVTQLDSIGGVGEYKDNPNHWINRCVARYYGIDSIIALLP